MGGDAREALYAGLLEALGYSRNRSPMLQLAQGLPLGRLQRLVGPGADRMALEALLLGAGGLLPRHRGLRLSGREEQRHSRELERLWCSGGKPLVVIGGEWVTSGVRPQNWPVRRLAGASFLIARYWESGLLEGLKAVVERGTWRELERSLAVESTGFWASHRDIHIPGARPGALVGRGRAREMAINVLLPLFFARAHLQGERELGQRSLTLFRRFPPGQDNEITREVRGLLLTSRKRQPVINSARRQQGLIHLYHVLQGRAT
jgi:hypothetical protein